MDRTTLIELLQELSQDDVYLLVDGKMIDISDVDVMIKRSPFDSDGDRSVVVIQGD